MVEDTLIIRYVRSTCSLMSQLFWENLIPQRNFVEPSGALKMAISSKYGSLDKFQTTFNATLAGIQGSGWGWLVKKDGELEIVTTPVALRSFQANGRIKIQ